MGNPGEFINPKLLEMQDVWLKLGIMPEKWPPFSIHGVISILRPLNLWVDPYSNCV